MKIPYMLVNSVRDVNPVMDITRHPLCASEDRKGLLIHHLYCFILTIKYACLFIIINWMLCCKLVTSVAVSIGFFWML